MAPTCKPGGISVAVRARYGDMSSGRLSNNGPHNRTRCVSNETLPQKSDSLTLNEERQNPSNRSPRHQTDPVFRPLQRPPGKMPNGRPSHVIFHCVDNVCRSIGDVILTPFSTVMFPSGPKQSVESRHYGWSYDDRALSIGSTAAAHLRARWPDRHERCTADERSAATPGGAAHPWPKPAGHARAGSDSATQRLVTRQWPAGSPVLGRAGRIRHRHSRTLTRPTH
jgi:hypothetical protein